VIKREAAMVLLRQYTRSFLRWGQAEQETLVLESRCLRRGSNRVLPEYEFRAGPLNLPDMPHLLLYDSTAEIIRHGKSFIMVMMAYFMVLSQHHSGGNEENHRWYEPGLTTIRCRFYLGTSLI
jgi:hypothetical protein